MSEPVIPPPPGYTYQGEAGPSIGPNILVANSVTIAFAIIAYGFRIYVKRFIVHKLHLADYLVTLALIGAIGRMATQVLLINKYQFGQHIWDYTTLDNISMWHFVSKIALLLYLFAIACAKMAMLCFYLQIFSIHRTFRWLCYALMVVVVGYCASFMLVTSLSCRPISAGWGSFLEVQSASCLDQVPLSWMVGGFNIATDALIVALPVPMVLKLKLRPGEMVGVLLILATGVLVVAVAIVRQVMIVGAGNNSDFTKLSSQVEMWQSIELNIGVAGACLPVLGPLRRKIRPAIDSLTSIIRARSRSRSSLSDVETVVAPAETKEAAIESRASVFEADDRQLHSDWLATHGKQQKQSATHTTLR